MPDGWGPDKGSIKKPVRERKPRVTRHTMDDGPKICTIIQYMYFVNPIQYIGRYKYISSLDLHILSSLSYVNSISGFLASKSLASISCIRSLEHCLAEQLKSILCNFFLLFNVYHANLS